MSSNDAYVFRIITNNGRLGVSKSGTGRVATYQDTKLVNIYTMEANYNTTRSVNPQFPMSAKDVTNEYILRDINKKPLKVNVKFNEEIFGEMGKALGISLLDYKNINPYSRLPNSNYKSLAGMQESVRAFISQSNKFGVKAARVSILDRKTKTPRGRSSDENLGVRKKKIENNLSHVKGYRTKPAQKRSTTALTKKKIVNE